MIALVKALQVILALSVLILNTWLVMTTVSM